MSNGQNYCNLGELKRLSAISNAVLSDEFRNFKSTGRKFIRKPVKKFIPAYSRVELEWIKEWKRQQSLDKYGAVLSVSGQK